MPKTQVVLCGHVRQAEGRHELGQRVVPAPDRCCTERGGVQGDPLGDVLRILYTIGYFRGMVGFCGFCGGGLIRG